MSSNDNRLQVGDVQGIYTVTQVDALGPLPAATINEGNPNAGLAVYLTSPLKRKALADVV